MKLHHRLVIILISTLTLSLSVKAGDFLIHDGDRVVFLGDSITEQRLYTTYVEAYALTRHPKWSLTFRNTGWGGDTAWLRQRFHPDEKKLFAADDATQQKMVEDSVGRGLARDVLPLKPTFVTIKFGMNDHAYQAFREDIFHAYVRSQTEEAKVLEAHGARVAFLTPQPIEDIKKGGANPDKDERNISLRKFCDGLKEVAAKNNAAFVDQFDPYMAMLLRERADNPPKNIGGGDAVHPGPIGHTVMAWAVLKGLGATALVSHAEIDATAKKVVSTEACRVSDLKADGDTVSFDRLDDALPMPIDERAETALKLAPILDDLDDLSLKVTGLAEGKYQVSIDGKPVAEVTSGDLARGWNYADVPGPITDQAREVLKWIFEKNNTFFERWRKVQLYEFPDWAKDPDFEKARAKVVARMDKGIRNMEDEIHKDCQPKSHHFELKRLS
jgi:hypothetical protein